MKLSGKDLPWIKTNSPDNAPQILELIELLKKYGFDGCVIFTVYSQNPMPAAMIAYMAEIPLRLAYCRENPYGLLTNWIPDKEPYQLIRHQVQRDLDLVAAIGANAGQKELHLTITPEVSTRAAAKLQAIGLDQNKPYLILHPGVSEPKREYPFEQWVTCGKTLLHRFDRPLLLTGSQTEYADLTKLREAIGEGVFVAGGLLSLAEFAAVVKTADAVISVNTGAVHLAAAVHTPVVVLYAQTNPQHTPWMVPHVVLPFSIEESMKSKNEVIKFVDNKIYDTQIPLPDDAQIAAAVSSLLDQPA
jgi:ADP-heptose:LPS heptosyltransferase